MCVDTAIYFGKIELNASAVKILLDGKGESMDLPFTPGPKEHEIIHYQSDPQRSIDFSTGAIGVFSSGQKQWHYFLHTQRVNTLQYNHPKFCYLSRRTGDDDDIIHHPPLIIGRLYLSILTYTSTVARECSIFNHCPSLPTSQDSRGRRIEQTNYHPTSC